MREAGLAMLEREPESIRGGAGGRDERRVVALAQVDDPRVVREVHRQQLRMAVDAQASDHEPLEIPGEEVGEPEGAGLGIGHRREPLGPREHLVAVRARETLHAFVGQHRIEQATGAAVRVRHEDPAVAVGVRALDPASNGGRDPLGPVVEVRSQTGDVEAGDGLDDREQLAGERAAADDERATCAATGPARRYMLPLGQLLDRLVTRAERPRAVEMIGIADRTPAERPGRLPRIFGSDAIASSVRQGGRSRPATMAKSTARAWDRVNEGRIRPLGPIHRAR